MPSAKTLAWLERDARKFVVAVLTTKAQEAMEAGDEPQARVFLQIAAKLLTP